MAAEFGLQDGEVVAILQQCHAKVESAFIDVFDRAKKEGEIDANADSRSLARVVMTTAQGLAVQSKMHADPEYVDSVIKALVSMIPTK